jgi:hypothetical protein
MDGRFPEGKRATPKVLLLVFLRPDPGSSARLSLEIHERQKTTFGFLFFVGPRPFPLIETPQRLCLARPRPSGHAWAARDFGAQRTAHHTVIATFSAGTLWGPSRAARAASARASEGKSGAAFRQPEYGGGILR